MRVILDAVDYEERDPDLDFVPDSNDRGFRRTRGGDHGSGSDPQGQVPALISQRTGPGPCDLTRAPTADTR